jgi:hypothetical protein
VAAKSIYKDVKEGNYGRAAVTAGATALSFTPAAPLVAAGGIIAKYYTDQSIEQRSFAAGSWVEGKTGSSFLGGVVSANAAVGLSIYESGVDMAKGVVGLFTDW